MREEAEDNCPRVWFSSAFEQEAWVLEEEVGEAS